MQPLYIELGDEITTVIGRMKEAEDTSVALVVPKGAILLQSVINLKLAKRAAAEAGKELTIITTDKIGHNLSKQVGIPIFSRLNDKNLPESDETEAEDDSHVINGVKVHRYYEEAAEAAPAEAAEAADPIVPKAIMKEAKKEEEAPEETPMKIRPVQTPEPEKKEKKEEEKPMEGEMPVILPVPEGVTKEAAEILAEDGITAATEEISVTESPVEGAPPTVTAVPAKKDAPKKKMSRKHHPLAIATYLLIVLLLAGGAAGAYYLPRTVVTVTVKATAWTKTDSIVAKAGTPIPAQTLTGEATATLTFKATGSKDIGAKATGSATLYNTLGSPLAVPAGTVVTANGQGFTTDAAVTIPAITYAAAPDGTPVGTPGSSTVNVTAQVSGTSSNMSGVSGTVAGSKAYARIVSTTGGTSQVVNVITAADVSAAQKALTEQLKTDSLAKLTEQMNGNDYLFNDQDDAFSFSGFTPSLTAGSQGDSATATAKGTLVRLVTDRKAVIAQAQTNATAAETAPSSTLFVDGTDITGTAFDKAAGTVTVATSTRGRLSPTIDAASLKNQLGGKKLADGVNLVKDASKGNTYAVVQTPTWWPLHNFPLSKHFLTVTVAYE